MNAIVSFIRRKILRIKRDRWNHQYLTGFWEGLKAPTEHARFGAIVALIERWKSNAAILEIGCGEGLLQQKLPASAYRRLVGVDLSDVAIERAKQQATAQTHYLVADMEVFDPYDTFDVVVFTESLNYARSPVQTLHRYEAFLKPEGILVVSMFESKHIPEIWNSLAADFTFADQIITQNERGTWHCRVLINKNKVQ